MRADSEGQAALRELLWAWDVIGLRGEGAPADEYDCMIDPLWSSAIRGRPRDETISWVARHTRDHFGLDSDAAADAALVDGVHGVVGGALSSRLRRSGAGNPAVPTFVFSIEDPGSGGWISEIAVRAERRRDAYAHLREAGVHTRQLQNLQATPQESVRFPWPDDESTVLLRRRLGWGEPGTWEPISPDALP